MIKLIAVLSPNLNKKRAIYIGIILIVFLAAGALVLAFQNGGENYEKVAVERRDLFESVNIVGEIEAETVSDLGFETSGQVRILSVREGQEVLRGQALASLDLGTLPAELRSAEANVEIKRASSENTAINIDTLKNKQNTLVESAYRNLLSDGLAAEPIREVIALTPPVITGSYDGTEGRYVFEVLPSSIEGKFDLHVRGLETPSPVRVSENKSTPLGTRGLYVSFSDAPRTYSGVEWFVDIPNKEGASYTSNLNSYEEAIRERDRAIEDVEAQLRRQNSGSSVSEAEIDRALAEVDRIKTLISKRTLTAPFSGTVSAVETSLGESVSVGEPIITLVATGRLSVEVDLPEVDYVKVLPGDEAQITLDALGEGLILSGEVEFVKNVETIVDGVSYYEAVVGFDEIDPRITSGMTAEIVIITDLRENVLTLPVRAVRSGDSGDQYVLVENTDGDISKADVSTGLRSTDGYFEIVVGVGEGDIVLVDNAG